MLRTYEWNGRKWRFEEGQEPEGAVCIAIAKETVKPGKAAKKKATKKAE